MAGVTVEVVVDSMEQCVSLSTDLGAAARGVMDVVALHSDEVSATKEQYSPVVTSIARSRPRGLTVKLCVANCHAVGVTVTGNEHLATDEGDLDVICCMCQLGSERGVEELTYRPRLDQLRRE